MTAESKRINKLKVAASLMLVGGIVALVAGAGPVAAIVTFVGFLLFVVSRFMD